MKKEKKNELTKRESMREKDEFLNVDRYSVADWPGMCNLYSPNTSSEAEFGDEFTIKIIMTSFALGPFLNAMCSD